MENVKETIAKNLVALRKSHRLTQGALAEKLNYSDKAVSRWEHAETLPDIETLCRICEIYGVSFEYLLQRDAKECGDKFVIKAESRARRVIICLITICTVWLAATLSFTTAKAVWGINLWQAFIWAIPASLAAVTVFNGLWWKSKVCSALAVSFGAWTLILALYLQTIAHNLWTLFIIGIPIQALIILIVTIPARKTDR